MSGQTSYISLPLTFIRRIKPLNLVSPLSSFLILTLLLKAAHLRQVLIELIIFAWNFVFIFTNACQTAVQLEILELNQSVPILISCLSNDGSLQRTRRLVISRKQDLYWRYFVLQTVQPKLKAMSLGNISITVPWLKLFLSPVLPICLKASWDMSPPRFSSWKILFVQRS